jgi:hypothetical protein
MTIISLEKVHPKTKFKKILPKVVFRREASVFELNT